jgi:hypothetical protein
MTGKSWFVWGIAALALAVGFGLMIARAEQPPVGPVEVVWDREACAHCRMHIGEKAFASQLQLEDGQVLNFDDPGCLFSYLAKRSVTQRKVYFRSLNEDRWLDEAHVEFIPTSPTPMGFGFGAVARGAHPGALAFDQAREAIHSRKAGH